MNDTNPEHAGLAREADARRRCLPIQAEYDFEPNVLQQGEGVWQHYIDEGPRDGAPLLFVHGNPTWSFAWRRLVRAFRETHRCIAVDHVGCGLSDKPADYPYRLAQHAENLTRLVETLDLRDVTLVVHDWGGPIGLGMARRLPERIARLVVTNTAAFRSERMPVRLAFCRLPLLSDLAVRGFNAFARGATTMAVEKPLSRAVKQGYLLPYGNWADRVAVHAFVADIPMRPNHPSWDELTATESSLSLWRERPVRILWGEKDWCFSPAFRAEWQTRLPHAKTFRFPAAGHYLFEDAGEALRQRLGEFLDEHVAPASSASTDPRT